MHVAASASLAIDGQRIRSQVPRPVAQDIDPVHCCPVYWVPACAGMTFGGREGATRQRNDCATRERNAPHSNGTMATHSNVIPAPRMPVRAAEGTGRDPCTPRRALRMRSARGASGCRHLAGSRKTSPPSSLCRVLGPGLRRDDVRGATIAPHASGTIATHANGTPHTRTERWRHIPTSSRRRGRPAGRPRAQAGTHACLGVRFACARRAAPLVAGTSPDRAKHHPHHRCAVYWVPASAGMMVGGGKNGAVGLCVDG